MGKFLLEFGTNQNLLNGFTSNTLSKILSLKYLMLNNGNSRFRSNKSLLMIKPDLPRPKTISPAFSLADKSEFQTKMEAAGLNQVQIVPIRKTFHVEDPGALWDGFFFD